MQRCLLEKDYRQEAQKLLLSVKRLNTKSGFRKYCNPFTGEGHRAKEFTWSGLVLDMILRQQEENEESEAGCSSSIRYVGRITFLRLPVV